MRVLDVIKWLLTAGAWGFVAYLLWGIAWYWALIWSAPGFFVVVNVIGFLMAPLYLLIGGSSPEADYFRRSRERRRAGEREINARLRRPREASVPTPPRRDRADKE